MDIQTEFVFFGRGDEGFLENYSYELDEDPEGRGGKLFMSLEILNNDTEAEEMGESLFLNLKQVFFEHLDRNPYDRFEEAIKKVNETLEEFRAGKASRFIGNLNILITALVGNELFLTQAGDAEAYMIRKRYVSVISEGLADEKRGSDFFTNIASGVLEPYDVVLLSSSRLLRYITKNDLAKFLTIPGKAQTLSEALSFLQDHLMTEILGRAAVIALQVPEAQEEEASMTAGEEKASRAVAFTGFIQKFSTYKYIKRVFSWGGAKTKNLLRRRGSRFSFVDLARDRIVLALIVSIVLLLIGIVFLRVKGSKREVLADQEAKLTQVQELISDAATQGQFDREKGAVLLKKAEDQALQVLNSRYLRSKASRLLDEIQRQRSLLDNVVLVNAPKPLVDLTAKRSAVSALGLIFLKDRLYAFSAQDLFEILLDKLMEPKNISESESIILGTAFPDKEALVFMTRSSKVVEFREGRFEFMDTADRVWKKGVDLEAYSDRLYVLDPERNQIWRYRRKRDAYDVGEGVNVDADLKNAVALAIDASVYVLSKDGKITLLYAGKKQDVPIHDSPFSNVKNPTKIYTDADLAQLFILEPSQKRVISFFKDRRQGGSFPTQLVYQNQYVFQGVGELRDLYASKDEGKLYVADESKVYVTNLAQ